MNLPDSQFLRSHGARHLRRGLIGWAVVWLVPYIAVSGFVGFGLWTFLVSTVYLGFVFGQALGYRLGMKDQEAMIDEIYGKHWRFDATAAQFARERQKVAEETAPWN